MLTVNAYAATSPTEPLVPTTITRRDVGPHDVLIEIAYAGVCHSDIHTVRGDWGPITYPQVVGHEVAGTVVEIGSDVTKHAVGDRVGVGTIVNSCRECDNCRAGQEQYCLERQHCRPTAASTGTAPSPRAATPPTSSSTRTTSSAFPSRWTSARSRRCCAPASPPTLRCGTGRPDRASTVAVVGMGGLGHLAVKLAHAMGAHVTVLSQTLSKRDDGLRYGADAYYATSDPDTFDQLANSFDLIINTVSAPSTSTPTCDCCAATAPWSASAPRPSRSRWPCSPCSGTDVPSPDPPPVASPRRKRCWTSAPSTASSPTPSSSTRPPSTTPGIESSAPTSATASSSTPPACTRPAKPAPGTKSLEGARMPDQTSDLAGKVAFVTGAASGIGRATAWRSPAGRRRGGRRHRRAAQPRDRPDDHRAGWRALAVRCDVTRGEDVQAALDQTVEAFGRLDYRLQQRRHRAPAQADRRDHRGGVGPDHRHQPPQACSSA